LAIEGTETGIPYQKDYEFYLEVLLKAENKAWALDVLDFFNQGVFGKKAPLSTEPSVPPSDAPRSWENDILAQLGNPVSSQRAEPEPLRTTTLNTTTTHSARTVDTTIPIFSSPNSYQHAAPASQADVPVVTSSHTSSMIISPRTSVISSTSELQADIANLSLGRGQEPSVSTRRNAQTGKRMTSTTIQPAPSTAATEEPARRVTHNRRGGKTAKN
jgi:hypothetical protein